MTPRHSRWRTFARWTATLSVAGLAPVGVAFAQTPPATKPATPPATKPAAPSAAAAPATAGAATLTRRILAAPATPLPVPDVSAMTAIPAPSPDPRVGLKAGEYDRTAGKVTSPAAEAIWNLKLLAHTPPSAQSAGATHSDLAFKGQYVLQGNYNGFEVWDISNPSAPSLKAAPSCPASQDDISVYENLLFLSSESNTGRLDCQTGGGRGAPGPTSAERMRGVRIFDISDIAHPALITQVQTCRGSHTHTLVTDPNDKANIYIYVSGTSGIRPTSELASCISNPLDPNNAIFNIEVIKVPLAHPEQAKVVSHPRIFSNAFTLAALPRPAQHGRSPADTGAAGGRGGRGGGGAGRGGAAGAAPAAAPPAAMPILFVRPGPSGKPPLVKEATGADDAAIKKAADALRASGWTEVVAAGGGRGGRGGGGGAGGRGGAGAGAPVDSLVIKGRAAMALVKPLGTTKADTARYIKTTDSLRAMGLDIPFVAAPAGLQQCHDITVYPGVGFAGGACAGMGLLLDIHDPANPKRLDAASDTNFSFWHSATFSNDGSKVLFSDEWGGGSAAYCRAADPINWGGDALFNIVDGKMKFKGYYKMPAAQTSMENCVAHNGSLIPIPGRDVMVQSFYQGGITVFDWTDPSHVKEIAFFDRGPIYDSGGSATDAGFWSSYYYNGYIYGSEIARGMDVFELTPSPFLSQNELDAAKLVHYDWLNVQDQPKFSWPANIVVVRSYLDQLVRWNGMPADQSSAISAELDAAMKVSLSARKAALLKAAVTMDTDAKTAKDGARVKAMAAATRELAAATK